ncbi:cytochrome P450 [Whalleya microplaca]|nr:cytochrome P450 [Whalleya microplaca]
MAPTTVAVAFGLTQDAREPPAIVTGVPFFGPLIGMTREKMYRLPIYTLRSPFSRMYVVNATELIPVLQKQWRTVSFAAFAADAGKLVGMSKKGVKILHRDLTSEHGFSVSWPKYVTPVIGPGKDLDAINRKVKVGLWQWSRQIMVISTTEAVWGPQNPYRDPAVAEAWRAFESGFLTLSVFPFVSLFLPKLFRAPSELVRKRYDHHMGFGLTLDDISRGELENIFAVLENSTPCALWVIYHIFSDDQVLADVRREISALVHEDDDGEGVVSAVDLARIRETCPVLLSTFQEVLRYRAVNPGPRVLLEDVHVDGVLKKGSMPMIPALMQHSDVSAWGQDAREFNYMRFAPTPGRRKPNRVAFRAFGSGHVLCPGRHFASTEIMALAALLALKFDVLPVAGKWIEPKFLSPMMI